jgi:putative copper resistance protein D
MDEPVVAGLRLVQYAGVALLLGVPVFLLSAGRDLTARAWVRPALVLAAMVVALGAAGALTAQTAVMAGSWSEALKPDSLMLVAFETPFGLSMVVRSGAALAALAAVTLMRTGRPSWSAATAAGLVAAGSFAWSGHAGSTEGAGAALHLAADVIHSIAAAVWLGALVALGLACVGPLAREAATAQAFARFSGVGTVAVASLGVTGLVNSAFLVGPDELAGLGETAYGRLLLLKLALFAGMLALAWANRVRLTPALRRGDDPATLARLRTSVSIETLLGLAVLAAVAVMGVQAPPGRG